MPNADTARLLTPFGTVPSRLVKLAELAHIDTSALTPDPALVAEYAADASTLRPIWALGVPGNWSEVAGMKSLGRLAAARAAAVAEVVLFPFGMSVGEWAARHR